MSIKNSNNKQLTTASTLFRVEAVVSYSYPPEHPGGYFNIIANKWNLTPLFDTSYARIYRLNSGRESYIANGGKLGRKKGCVKTTDSKKEVYKEVISFLKRGYSVRNTAKLSSVSISTVQRVKREFCI